MRARTVTPAKIETSNKLLRYRQKLTILLYLTRSQSIMQKVISIPSSPLQYSLLFVYFSRIIGFVTILRF